MTKAIQHKVTCASCGFEFPALVIYSTISVLPSPGKLDENGVCPECNTKNEVSVSLPRWENPKTDLDQETQQ